VPIKIYPLGGFEQIGRNSCVIEVDGDLFIVDLGVQFPDEDMLGIDYLIPDVSCLKGRENRIKGVFFTHAHFDHIGAAHHILPQLQFAPCYGLKLTLAMVRKRLDEDRITAKCRLNTVQYGQTLKFGRVEVEFIRVTHSIPDAAAIAFHTPYGTVLHTGDFKVDLNPIYDAPMDFQRFAELGKKGVLAIIAESTNAQKPGFSPAEREIQDSLRDAIVASKGRIIISTFSSLLTRVQQIIDVAKETDRKIYLSGRSMEENIDLALQLGYLKAPRGLVRKVGPGMEKLQDREVIIITTGAQGQENAGLARMGLGTHRHIIVKKGDTVILSSNPISGNERAVAKVVNNLHEKGARVLKNSELALHVTGHGYQQDLLLMHQLVRAKHIIPEHGEPMMKSAHADLARSIGYAENQVHLLANGEILEFDTQGNARRSKQKYPVRDIIIDGRGSGSGEGERTITDRKVMSTSGAVILLLKAYSDSMRLVGDPDVISRGLLYGSEQQEITRDIALAAKKAYEEELARGSKDRKELKRAVTGALFRYFDRKLDREPMVIPIVIEV
jgi:ribonuclease J